MRRPGVLAALALVLVACAAPSPSPTPIGLGGTWTAVEVGGLAPVPGSEPRVQFTGGGRIEGTTGCNDFGGEYRVERERIAVGELIQTEIGCPGAVGQVEAAFTRLLGGAERVEAGDGGLVLAGPGGAIRFVQGAPAGELLGLLRSGPWRIVAGTGLARTDVFAPVRFDDGTLISVGRCGFGGRYVTSADDRIEIRDVGYDAISCGSPEADAARDVVVRLLDAAATVEATGGGAVVLRGGAGELRLEPAD